jgi:hypothetical protein
MHLNRLYLPALLACVLALILSPRASAADAKPAPRTTWEFSAALLAMPDGKPAAYVADNQRMFKVVDDPDAVGGKALQVNVDKRIIRDSDIQVLSTPPITLEEAPVGLYKITVRMKLTGTTNAIGTAMRFTGKDLPAVIAGKTKARPASNLKRYQEPTIHGYMFNEADVYQEFSFLTEVIEPDTVSLRPSRALPKNPLSLQRTMPSKPQMDRLLAGQPLSAEDQKNADEEKAKTRELDEDRYQAGLHVDLSLLRVTSVGFGRSRNTIQTLTVDRLKIERVKTPVSAEVRQVLPQKIQVYPGDDQLFHVWMHNRSGKPQTGELRLSVTHDFDEKIEVAKKAITIESSKYAVVDVPWTTTKNADLWGCTVTAEFMQDGKPLSSAEDVFSVHSNPWAIMNFGGGHRNANPYYDPPDYRNFQEFFGATIGDGLKPFPDDPELPYFSGIAGYPTSLPFQKLLVQHNRSIGVVSFLYIWPGATSYNVELQYEKHPERQGGRLNWTDMASDLYVDNTAELVRRWKAGEKQKPDAALWSLICGCNDYFDDVYNGKVDGVVKMLRFVGYDGVRWDSDPFSVSSGTFAGKSFGPESTEAAQKLVVERTNHFKEVLHKEFPRFTEGANGLIAAFGSRLYDRKFPPPEVEKSPAFMAFLKDGSSIMDEGWMNAWMFSDPRNIIKDYFWGARQEVDACRRAGGFLHTFSPERDGTPYFTQSAIYYNHLIYLAGAQYPGGVSCSPGSETGLAHFMTRYSQFLWDNKLLALNDAVKVIHVEAPGEPWWDESAVQRDLPDGRKRYVIPIVNPPTQERFFRDQFSELPEPIKEPFAVEVKLPAGFKSATVHMLSAEPRTSCVALKSAIEDGSVRFEVPGLVLYRVLVVEFEK